MEPVNILDKFSSEYLATYFISLMVSAIIGIGIIEWFDKRFEGFISPLYDKIIARRKYVLEKRKNSIK